MAALSIFPPSAGWLTGGALIQPVPDESYANDGNGHRFCFIYWEHGPGTCTTSLYYIDTPNPEYGAARGSDTPPSVSFRSQGRPELFIERMRRLGWQIYQQQADQESYRYWLMRCPPLDEKFEHCILTNTIHTLPSGKESYSHERGIYRLGDGNRYMLTLDQAMADQSEVLRILAEQKWEFTHQEEFAVSQPSNRVMRLQYYRRPRGTT